MTTIEKAMNGLEEYASGKDLRQRLKDQEDYQQTVADLRRQLAEANNVIVVLRHDFNDLMRDKARIDWLGDRKQNIGRVVLPTECVERNLGSLRGAIDDAMNDEDCSTRDGTGCFQYCIGI